MHEREISKEEEPSALAARPPKFKLPGEESMFDWKSAVKGALFLLSLPATVVLMIWFYMRFHT